MCEDLTVNGLPLSEWCGATLLDYTVGETDLSNPYFIGASRTTPILLQTITGMRELEITIQFSGETLHDAKLNRSRFNAQVAGQSEIYIPDDGFYYTCICQKLGEETLVGQGGGLAKVEATYTFSAIRHGELISETLGRYTEYSGGLPLLYPPRVFCLSTMPKTDAKFTTTADAAATSFTLMGCTFGSVAKDDVICIDGIKKIATINNVNSAASMDWGSWTHFPYLVPGFNEMEASYVSGGLSFENTKAITVEYYPVYI